MRAENNFIDSFFLSLFLFFIKVMLAQVIISQHFFWHLIFFPYRIEQKIQKGKKKEQVNNKQSKGMIK